MARYQMAAANIARPPEWLTVDFETLVPLEYWQNGAQLIPESARARVERLMEYQQVWDGDFRQFLAPNDRRVINNLFRKTATWMADALMATPPQMTVPDGSLLTPRYIAGLQHCLYHGIIDFIRYGVCLLRISHYGEFGWQCAVPQPLYWYPAADGQALVEVTDGGKAAIVTKDYGDGSATEQRFDVKQAALAGGGDIVEVGDTNHDPAAWRVVGESLLGRTGLLLGAARNPATGDWGLSAYEDCFSPIMALTRMQSQLDQAVYEHADPKLKLLRPDGQTELSSRQQLHGQTKRSSDAIEEYKFKSSLYDRDKVAVAPPPGFKDIQPLKRLEDVSAQISLVQINTEVALAHANVPASLLLLDPRAITPQSGKALALQNLPTAIAISGMHRILSEWLRKGLLIGEYLHGASADQLRTFAEELRIEWTTLWTDFAIIDEGGGELEQVEDLTSLPDDEFDIEGLA